MKRLLLAAALVSAAGQACAQRATEQETGSRVPIPRRARIPESGSASDAVRARIVMAEYARCVVAREYQKVAQVIALPAGEPFNNAVRALATDECLDSGMLRFQAVAMRGPLFVELYRRRIAAERSGRAWGPVVTRIDLTTPLLGLDASAQQQQALMAFGDCVVKRDGEIARRVVLAPTASDAQDRAIAAIAPHLGPCILQGTTLHLGKQVVEGMLAEVLYRGVSAPAAGTPATEKTN